MTRAALITFWRHRLAFPCLALLLPWTALMLGPQPINHDVAWFFYVARGVLRGGVLYRDFIEPNAPLASLSLIPAVWLSRVLTIAPGTAVELTVLTIAGIAMALCAEVLRCMRATSRHLLFALVTLTVTFVLLPKYFFGQREHILSMLLTPYILGCAAGCAGIRLPRALGCAIGIAAAMAVGLKPPFILVPVVLELVVFARAGFGAIWRAQPISLGVGLALLIATTLLFFPLYATSVIPWATALYGGYDQPRILRSNLEPAIVAFALLWWGWTVDREPVTRAVRACLAAAFVAALAAFALQGKGWRYQELPAWMFLGLMIAGAIVTTRLLPAPSPTSWLRWSSPRLVAVGFVVLIARQHSPVDMARFAGVAQAIAAEPGPFVILSTDVVPAFPLALEQNRVWASRTPCLIMLPGLVQAEQRGRVSPWEAPFRQWINADMRRYSPALVFVPSQGDRVLPPRFDILAWLLRDPEFVSIWANYRQDGMRNGFKMFRLS